MNKVEYKGFSIEKETVGYAVRLYQQNPELVHDFKPWADSLAEAKAIVDKLNGAERRSRG